MKGNYFKFSYIYSKGNNIVSLHAPYRKEMNYNIHSGLWFKELPACPVQIFNSQRISYLCENHLSDYQKHLVTCDEHETQCGEVLICCNQLIIQRFNLQNSSGGFIIIGSILCVKEKVNMTQKTATMKRLNMVNPYCVIRVHLLPNYQAHSFPFSFV